MLGQEYKTKSFQRGIEQFRIATQKKPHEEATWIALLEARLFLEPEATAEAIAEDVAAMLQHCPDIQEPVSQGKIDFMVCNPHM